MIIHSSRGDVSATEAIENYLIKFFDNDIRVFILQIAMLGGTMLFLFKIHARHTNIDKVKEIGLNVIP